MKKIISILMLFLLSLTLTIAAQTTGIATVTWDAVPDTDVVGYNVYSKPITSTTFNVLNVVGKANLTANIPVLPGAAYEMYVTAYNTSNLESDPSNKIRYTMYIVNGSGKATPVTLIDSTAANYSTYQLLVGPAVGTLTGTAPTLTFNPSPTFTKDVFSYKSPELFSGTNINCYYSLYKRSKECFTPGKIRLFKQAQGSSSHLAALAVDTGF
jgi:hypothetical protein